jgi:hypothetical protein
MSEGMLPWSHLGNSFTWHVEAVDKLSQLGKVEHKLITIHKGVVLNLVKDLKVAGRRDTDGGLGDVNSLGNAVTTTAIL